jgi:hypothetical protein
MEQQARLIIQAVQLALPPTEPTAIVAEGRVLDAVAASVLRGTVDEIARKLGLSVGSFRAAVTELSSIGWVEVTKLSDGALSLDLPGDAR